jgi:hypothetical protein
VFRHLGLRVFPSVSVPGERLQQRLLARFVTHPTSPFRPLRVQSIAYVRLPLWRPFHDFCNLHWYRPGPPVPIDLQDPMGLLIFYL